MNPMRNLSSSHGARLSILIPCYNEPDTIGNLLERVEAVQLPGYEREVIVIDDGSEEATKRALEEERSKHPELVVITRERNGGKGAALKDGMRTATGDYLIIQDADLEYDPADIPKLLAALSPAHEVVWGSRQMEHNNVPGRFYYYWGGRAVNVLFNLAFGTRLTDLTTCYKLFPKRLIPALLAQPSDDFVFDGVELSRVLAREGVVEVPIHYRARTAHEGKKLRAKDGIRFLMRIITLRFAPHIRIIKFLLVGGSAALINLLALYLLTGWLGLWYVLAEVIAFLIALAYNFTLQKLWAFEAAGRIERELPLFVVANLTNLAINAVLLYSFVEYLGIHYLPAQAIASALIALESYFLYRWIFR